MTANYVEWDGDWAKRPAASLKGTNLHLFPLVADYSALLKLCQERFDVPSGGRVQVKPLGKVGEGALVILVAADLPKIKSLDVDQNQNDGYLAERDVGFFVPVRYTVGATVSKIGVFIPYLYVDNAAAVIMGREIHGFPKILASIGFVSSSMAFDVSTLVFPTVGPDVKAENREILRTRRGPWFPFNLPLLNQLSGIFQNAISTTTDLGVVAAAILKAVGLQDLAPTNDFNEVTFLFLKQLRAVAGHPGTDFQEVVAVPGAVVSLPSSVQVEVWPLFWPVKVTFTEYARSVNIPTCLGLPATVDVLASFRITADLEIRDGTIL